MLVFSETHAATNAGAGISSPHAGRTDLHIHTAEYLCDSGTGGATVTHYGRNSSDGGWFPICEFVFTDVASGTKAEPKALEHNWDQYKTECSAITGTGARVVSTMSGA